MVEHAAVCTLSACDGCGVYKGDGRLMVGNKSLYLCGQCVPIVRAHLRELHKELLEVARQRQPRVKVREVKSGTT